MRADVRQFLRATATATATNSMFSACAAERARRTTTKTASVTAKTHASVPSMPVAFATAPVQCTLVDARTSLQEIAIATEMNSMPSECAVERVRQTPTKMAFATALMRALVQSMPAASATARARFMHVDVQESRPVTVIAMGMNWMHLGFAEVPARQMRMRTVSATMWIRA